MTDKGVAVTTLTEPSQSVRMIVRGVAIRTGSIANAADRSKGADHTWVDGSLDPLITYSSRRWSDGDG